MPVPPEEVLFELIDEIRKKSGVPGVSLAMTSEGKTTAVSTGITDVRTGTQMTVATRFEMSCLMKFLLSLTVLYMAEKGQFNLDAPATELLSELQGPSRGFSARHLLSHTSGYHGLDVTDPKIRWGYTWAQFADRIKSSPTLFDPGEVFNYEHSEHVILGQMLQRHFGCSARSLVQATVLEPLGITAIDGKAATLHKASVANHFSDSTRRLRVAEIPAFSGFWADSLPDLTITPNEACQIAALSCTWLRASPRIRDWFCEPAAIIPAGVRSNARCEDLPACFGLACGNYRNGWLGHNGSGFGQTCGLRFNPNTGDCLAVGINTWDPHARDITLRRAMAMLENAQETRAIIQPDDEFSIEILAPGIPVQELYGNYVGSYMGLIHVSDSGNGIMLRIGADARRSVCVELRRTSINRYRVESPLPISLRFSSAGTHRAGVLNLGMYAYRKVEPDTIKSRHP